MEKVANEKTDSQPFKVRVTPIKLVLLTEMTQAGKSKWYPSINSRH